MTTSHAPHKQPNAWWVGTIAGMASYIDAAAIVSSGIALVLYQHSIGLTENQIGILSALLTVGIATGALLGGRLGDRFGRRRVFLITMLLIAVGAGLLALSQGFALLALGTIMVGLGAGGDLPVSLATISEAADESNRGKLIGFSQILWTLGILVTMGMSTIIGGWGQLGGQILYGHVAVISAIVFVLRWSIPESVSWQAARDERDSSVATVRSQLSGLKDIFTNRAYLVPFVAILVFYTLVNLSANTSGQFGAYVAVNVVGISVQANSVIGLISLPVGILLGLWFMKIVDGPHRMTYYAVGACFSIAGLAAPAVFGFSLATLIAIYAGAAVGGAFAFEAIMKVWSQESFPTLLRSSAQGAIISVARFSAAGLALVTPALLGQARLMYAILAILVSIGMVVGWVAFHRGSRNMFEVEAKAVETVETPSSH